MSGNPQFQNSMLDQAKANGNTINTADQLIQNGDAGMQSNPFYRPPGAFIGTPPPAPFVPAPLALTPTQNAANFTPPPNLGVQNDSLPSPLATTGGQLAPPTGGNAQAPSLNWPQLMMALGLFGNPQQQQPQTAAAPMNYMPQQMDFHSQLQNFINSGLMGGTQRIQG